LAVCHDGTILKTTNGGEDWTNFGIVINNRLNDVKYYNADTAFICAGIGKVYFSGDAGESWTLKNTGISASLTKILFVEDTIYISGDKGTILKSTDIGETWTLEETFTSIEINDIKTNHKGNIFTCGKNATIFRYGEYVPTLISEPYDNIKSFSVFPNPAGSFINIVAENSPETSMIIEIYDMQGKNVFTQNYHQAHSVSIDVNNLLTGIYMVRVVAGNITSTKKLIIK
jgi:hypothetical protein